MACMCESAQMAPIWHWGSPMLMPTWNFLGNRWWLFDPTGVIGMQRFRL